MIRVLLLSFLMIPVIAQAPVGCPVQTPTFDTSTPRGAIATTAGAPAAANVGEVVTLSASATTDAEGGAIAYSWLQTAGAGVAMRDATTAGASFTVPSLPDAQVLKFLVTTRNDRGDVGRAEVQITVAGDLNYAPPTGLGGSAGGSRGPTAIAGSDQIITEGDVVTLSAGASRGSALRYSWRQTGGPAVTLSDPTAERLTFTAPAFAAGAAPLTFVLEVTDTRGRTASDTVIVNVSDRSETPTSSRVRIGTTLGDIVIELDAERAPVSVENFLSYVDDGFYDGLIFHRVIPGFVVQGGGFLPGLTQRPPGDPIVNEGANGLTNDRGTIAMARTSDPDSATAQFYFNLVDNDSLNATDSFAGYAVFGRVVEGLTVIDQIATQPTGERNGFSDVPLTDITILFARREQ